MNELYETKISDARWIAYDIPGNIGWIIWFVCLFRCLTEGWTAYAILSVIPALFMLVGIAELISERIKRLDRVLPKSRLLRGFGALTLGGVSGIPVSIVGLWRGRNGSLPLWMLLGAVLCGLFAGLCFIGYKRKNA